MIKLAWLVWDYEDTDHPTMMLVEPDWAHKKLQIAYFVVQEPNDDNTL